MILEEQAIAVGALGLAVIRVGPRAGARPGAIGILAVKKTKHGVYFYFGHNTDSFALASMHSDEYKPVTVMSRAKQSGHIAQGARKCRARRASKA